MSVSPGVPERLRQPAELQQSAAEALAQRQAWLAALAPHPPAPYLVVAGVRVATPFLARAFDVAPTLRLDAPLPAVRRVGRLLAHLGGLGRQLLRRPRASVRAWRHSATVLQHKERWRMLWAQGHFGLCKKPRQRPDGSGVRAVVLHWDMCNSSAQCLEVLQRRGLSAHLLVDADGSIYQLLDLARDVAFHAGWINEQSIGIEINNPVALVTGPSTGASRARVAARLAHTYEEAEHLDFTPAQKAKVAQLVTFLCDHFAVPRRLPDSVDAAGNEREATLVPGEFAGVCGHYHVGSHKADPGHTLWPVLRAAWR